MYRRTFLGRGAVAVARGLAGCSGGSENGTEPPPTAVPTPTSTEAPVGDGRAPTTTTTPSPRPTATPTSTASPTATPLQGTSMPAQTVVVGPGGSLRFEPASFRVDVGDDVLWTWDSGGHNVRPSATPDGSDWVGTAGGDGTTYGGGHTHRATFGVAGTYDYYCAPHRPAGMTGTITVG